MSLSPRPVPPVSASSAHFVVLTPQRASASRVAGSAGSGIFFFPLDQPVTRIGSAHDAELFLPDPELSGICARVELRGHQWVLVREGHSLLVNGQRVRVHVLAAFDMIVIGKSALGFRSGPVPPPPSLEPERSGVDVEAVRRMVAFTERARRGEHPRALTEQLLADLIALTGASRASLVRLSSDDDPLSLMACDNGTFSSGEAVLSRTLLAKMRTQERSIFVANTLTDPDLTTAASMLGEPATTALCSPVVTDDRIVGALYLSRRGPASIAPHALELVELYATHAVDILEGERRRAHLAAKLDALGETTDDESFIIGEADSMRALKRTVRKVASSRAPVLVTGETGTGKELVARELHRLSPRARGPFVAVNCGVIPHELLASELFGHRKGAFTGATGDRLGFFRSAEGGTLFLDEIGDMPLAQQVALLRVLQEEHVVPVGAEHAVPVDARVVCASNRRLVDEVRDGRFRQDLYFRLNVVELTLPPLRERAGDVMRLAEFFLRRYERESGARAMRFGDDALAAMHSAPWTGNVRELEATVRRAILMAEGDTLSAADLRLAPARTSALPGSCVRPLSMARDEFLRQYVREVVDRYEGNRTAAAAALMVSARTVFKYLDE